MVPGVEQGVPGARDKPRETPAAARHLAVGAPCCLCPPAPVSCLSLQPLLMPQWIFYNSDTSGGAARKRTNASPKWFLMEGFLGMGIVIHMSLLSWVLQTHVDGSCQRTKAKFSLAVPCSLCAGNPLAFLFYFLHLLSANVCFKLLAPGLQLWQTWLLTRATMTIPGIPHPSRTDFPSFPCIVAAVSLCRSCAWWWDGQTFCLAPPIAMTLPCLNDAPCTESTWAPPAFHSSMGLVIKARERPWL